MSFFSNEDKRRHNKVIKKAHNADLRSQSLMGLESRDFLRTSCEEIVANLDEAARIIFQKRIDVVTIKAKSNARQYIEQPHVDTEVFARILRRRISKRFSRQPDSFTLSIEYYDSIAYGAHIKYLRPDITVVFDPPLT